MTSQIEITEQTLNDAIMLAKCATTGTDRQSYILWKFFMMMYGFPSLFTFDELRLVDDKYIDAVRRLIMTFAGTRHSFLNFVEKYKYEIDFDFRRERHEWGC